MVMLVHDSTRSPQLKSCLLKFVSCRQLHDSLQLHLPFFRSQLRLRHRVYAEDGHTSTLLRDVILRLVGIVVLKLNPAKSRVYG